MKSNIKLILLFVAICHLPFANLVFAASSLELDQALKEKTRKLQEVHQQLQETQQNLSEKEEQSRGLKQELTRLGSNIKQLNLGIESSRINIEKLELEIESLQADIKGIEENIISKKNAVVKLLRKLQEKDNETPMMAFFRNRSLSASITEAIGVSALNSDLGENIEDLKNLQDQLADKLGQTTSKKKSIELEHQNFTARKKIITEKEGERKSLLAQTNQQKKIYEQQLSDLERQQMAIAEEVEAIENQLRSQTDPNLIPAARPGVLGWPVFGRLSQGWGATKFARYGYRGKWHNGIDISGPYGTAVMAAEKGIVLAIGDQDQYCRKGAYGKYIVIKHPNNLVTLYGHLSGFGTAVGNIVSRGDIIGYMGSTGYSTGSHLHFTVYDSKTYGMRSSASCGLMPSGGDLNPLNYL